MMREMRSTLSTFGGASFPCLQSEVYNLTEEVERITFLKNKSVLVHVPRFGSQVVYNNSKKIGVTLSALGTNKAICLGAYAYALAQLDSE